MSINVRTILEGHEFIGDWLRFVEPFEYQESYSVFALLTVASAAIDGRIIINPGYKPETMPNIFTVLYGPPATRKTEALKDAMQDLLVEAIPETRLLGNNLTPEYLRNKLVRETKERGAATGIVYSDEFTTLIGGAEYQKHGALFLSKLWESPRPYEDFGTIAHGKGVVENRYVVVAAGATPQAFEDLSAHAVESGLIRRTIFVVEDRKRQKAARPRMDTTRLNRLRTIFRDRLGPQAFKDARLLLDEEADAANEAWYNEDLDRLVREHEGMRWLDSIESMQVKAFKVASILHVLEGGRPTEDDKGRPVFWLDATNLRRGFALMEALLPGTIRIYNSLVSTPFARLKVKMVRILHTAGRAMSDVELETKVAQEAGVASVHAQQAKAELLKEGTLRRCEKGLTLG